MLRNTVQGLTGKINSNSLINLFEQHEIWNIYAWTQQQDFRL